MKDSSPDQKYNNDNGTQYDAECVTLNTPRLDPAQDPAEPEHQAS
jgi:hypothetical protein